MIFEINIFYSKLCGGKNANNLLMILISKSQFRKQETYNVLPWATAQVWFFCCWKNRWAYNIAESRCFSWKLKINDYLMIIFRKCLTTKYLNLLPRFEVFITVNQFGNQNKTGFCAVNLKMVNTYDMFVVKTVDDNDRIVGHFHEKFDELQNS